MRGAPVGAAGPALLPLGAILAGGRASRMGADKASVPLEGVPLIERVWDRVRRTSRQVVVVGGAPRLAHRGVALLPDLYPAANAFGGLATALRYLVRTAGEGAWLLCVGCDMPFVSPRVVACLARRRGEFDAVVPRTPQGLEPLCALYRATCLPPAEEEIGRGNLTILDLFGRVRTREVGEAELRRADPHLASFLNVNRPDDLDAARRMLHLVEPLPAGAGRSSRAARGTTPPSPPPSSIPGRPGC